MSSSAGQGYENVIVEQHERAGLIRFNRPKALNALNQALINDIVRAASAFDANEGIGAIVLTGSEKAFAAGADIKEMANLTYAEAYLQDKFSQWQTLTRIRKPLIAAVNGFALGGGCELAMMCDIIIAGEKAQFGQPEIKLGVIPGWGGTQRLIRAVGKSKAMEMVLTGNMIDAQRAERDGLVAKVVAPEDLVQTALDMANKIGGFSSPSVLMAKETVNAAYETTMQEGLRLERRLFQSLFAMEDQKEGMAAFAAKRTAEWKHK